MNYKSFQEFLKVTGLTDASELVGTRESDGKNIRITIADLKTIFKGDAGTSIQIQYSANGINWHAQSIEGDTYIRFKEGDNAWSIAFNIYGSDGIGIESMEIKYQASSSGTTEPTGEWETSIPIVDDGDYLWTRVVLFFFKRGFRNLLHNWS